jgi:hypothetical protein
MIASDQASAMTEAVVNLTGGSLVDSPPASPGPTFPNDSLRTDTLSVAAGPV